MSNEYADLIRDTIAKSMAVGGELMRQTILRVLVAEFAQMTEGVDIEGRKAIILERIKELPLP